MKTILCYGDSNTWGFEPVTRNRYGRTERWTGILRQELGLDYDVIEEGLNGRTTVWDDPIEGHKNGKERSKAPERNHASSAGIIAGWPRKGTAHFLMPAK